jgi:hypothetical protein
MGFLKGLYPSLAISDCVTVAGHAAAALMCYEGGLLRSAAGFLSVSIAGSIGVYRFGFDEGFSTLHANLTDMAAFVGLPLVGYDYLLYRCPGSLRLVAQKIDPIIFALCLVLAETFTRSMHPSKRELIRTVINAGFFVVPAFIGAYAHNNTNALVAIVLFLIAAVVIGPERHKYLLGLRREDWFHYIIGVCAYFIALGLPI